MIKFVDLDFDTSIVAPIIYRSYPHQTTGRGVSLSSPVITELSRFLGEFNSLVGVRAVPYYRLDAYFDETSLWILEINAAFVDGWGTALNLARAGGATVDSGSLAFPKRFVSLDCDYLPELELFVEELATLGLVGYRVCRVGKYDSPTYVYGRADTDDQPHVLPYDGLRLDNKFNLGLFSRTWNSDVVKTPRHYMGSCDSWEKIPLDAVLKFADKGGADCKKARWSVCLGKPSGKAPFIKKCYQAETLLAQDFIPPMKEGGKNCQLVILAIGDTPVTGYVQYSGNQIINDNSTHGPLIFGE